MHVEESNAASGRGESYEPQDLELLWVTSVGPESLHLHVLHLDAELFAFSQRYMAWEVKKHVTFER